ncbi:hypothetical protein ACWF7H_29480, partial [Peribacillus butanolivorans]
GSRGRTFLPVGLGPRQLNSSPPTCLNMIWLVGTKISYNKRSYDTARRIRGYRQYYVFGGDKK